MNAEEILRVIRAWVEIETPTTDGAAVNRLVDLVAADARDLGMRVERLPGPAVTAMAIFSWRARPGAAKEPLSQPLIQIIASPVAEL
jgi:hypothetical protein